MWLDADEFRAMYLVESATEISDLVIENCLTSATSSIRRHVGQANVDKVTASADNLDQISADLREAQEYLALKKLSYREGFRFKNGGTMDSERDENNSVTVQYRKFGDVEKMRESLEKSAWELIQVYVGCEEQTASTIRLFRC